MLYLMRRARLIMEILEAQIDELEKEKVQVTFTQINHPDCGCSGSKMIWEFMFCLVVLMLLLGIPVIFGLNKLSGVLLAILFITLVSVRCWLTHSFKHWTTRIKKQIVVLDNRPSE